MGHTRALLVCGTALLSGGCSLFADDAEPAVASTTTAHARAEPLSKRGNPSHYTQNGKTYYIKARAPGYRERGIASWYGEPFHGRQTSNGEVYDMHKISAAHKTLPLPSWVAVTDLQTGRQITVRVNDRGPFHPGRIIDLSYAAAQQLGMANRGVADVEVRVITGPLQASTKTYLQLGAFREIDNAERFLRRVRDQGVARVALRTDAKRNMNLVVYGPVPKTALDAARRNLRAVGITRSTLVSLP